jgi:bifunctional pyridoxal-dependent enzyme with beta-cystathionase and maltose regulon repressor activities
MASAKRIKKLETFYDQWKKRLVNEKERRKELISWKEDTNIFENDIEEDLLPMLIIDADFAVETIEKILKGMEALIDRAKSGEDV